MLELLNLNTLPITPTGLEDTRCLRDTDTAELVDLLRNYERATSLFFWLRADIGAELFTRFNKDSEFLNKSLRVIEFDQTEFEFANRIEEIGWGVIIPRELRRVELNSDFHVEVARCLGTGFDHAEFSEWLQKAIDNNWKVKDLRREIRSKGKVLPSSEIEPGGSLEWLNQMAFQVQRVTRKRPETLSSDEAEAAGKAIDSWVKSLSEYRSQLSQPTPR